MPLLARGNYSHSCSQYVQSATVEEKQLVIIKTTTVGAIINKFVFSLQKPAAYQNLPP